MGLVFSFSDPAWPQDEPWSSLVGGCWVKLLESTLSLFLWISTNPVWNWYYFSSLLYPCLTFCLCPCWCPSGERVSRLWETIRRSRSNWRTWKPAWETAARKSSQVGVWRVRESRKERRKERRAKDRRKIKIYFSLWRLTDLLFLFLLFFSLREWNVPHMAAAEEFEISLWTCPESIFCSSSQHVLWM